MIKKKNFSEYSITVVFLLLVFAFSIITVVAKPKSYSAKERRPLQQMPEITWSAIKSGEFGKDYEKYLTDQFILRDHWIQLKTTTERMLGRQESNQVYFGKNGYLIEKFVVTDKNKEQWEKNKKWVTDFLNTSQKILGKNHVKAMLVPTASYILKDKLPPYADTYDQGLINKEVEKLVKPDILVDVNKALLAKKNEGIYYRTDHHWTSLGAYYAYREWAKSVGLQPKKLSDFHEHVVKTDFYGTIYNKVNTKVVPDTITLYEDEKPYEISINMGEKKLDGLYDKKQLDGDDPYSVFLGGNNAMTQVISQNKNGRRLLVIKDSYAHSFVPFLAGHFEEILLIDLRYLNMPVLDLYEQYQITDLLVLYNNATIMNDRNLVKLLP